MNSSNRAELLLYYFGDLWRELTRDDKNTKTNTQSRH